LKTVSPSKASTYIAQTDNGSEFLEEFDEYLKDKHIKHFFIYLRYSEINKYPERVKQNVK